MRTIRIANIVLVLLLLLSNSVKAQSYAESSVLATGRWYKIKVTEPGIVKIRFSDIEAMGFSSSSIPAIYGNNTGLLSYWNSDTAPDDLVPVPLYVQKGSDNIFNDGDFLLFYSDNTHRWDYSSTDGYSFRRHYYSDTAIYFISDSRPAQEISVQTVQPGANYQSEYHDFLAIHDIEKENILKSGREWYEPISINQDILFNSLIPNGEFESGETVKYDLRVLARSNILSSFRFVSGASILSSIPVAEVNIFNTAGTYARAESIKGEFNIESYNNDLRLQFFNNGNNSARGWLDYLALHLRLKSKFEGTDLYIKDYKSAETGRVSEFVVETANEDLYVWDISEGNSPSMLITSYSSGKLRYIANTDTLKTFLVFNPNNANQAADIVGPVDNQNLHAPSAFDMIILSPGLFKGKATELADIHYQNEGLISKVVTLEQVYNEFSGGIPDISAIRNYVRMVYVRNQSAERPLKYLTLFGDGSYENKILPPHNPNFIPTYQTQNSNVNILSFTSDDYYGLLDEDEGESEGYLDIGIGRLPVSDTIQANIVLNKIREYLNPDNMGPWRNKVIMIADDEDSNAHINDAESLAGQLSTLNPQINIDKVYLDSYVQQTSINGASYPDASEAINAGINDGCLIFNYLGHGSEKGLAHERVVKVEDINAWSNAGRLPVFITATCEFSRFDDIDIDHGTGEISQITSAGELVLLSPKGGGIALLTTTRIVYSAPNYILNSRIYENAFTLDDSDRGRALGEIVKLAKNNAGSGDNKRNFTLLGDPAVRLAHAWNGPVTTDSINGIDIAVFNDTIKALSKIDISGHLSNNTGLTEIDANGIVNVVIYDKKYNISTLANDGGNTFEFSKQDRVLFKGKAEVEDGLFNIKAIIPRDIDYLYDYGKISYYAQANEKDYAGVFNDLMVGGFNNLSSTDTTGPQIELFINDTLFRPGGICDRWPSLLALISDPGGINTAGTGIGHDIVFYLDEDRSNSTVLNNFYENELNSYTSGSLRYNLNEMERGKHTLSLRVWDNFNNSSTETLVFIVETDEGFVLNDLINYPNPVVSETSISLGHNRPGIQMDIDIDIISTNGRLVKRIESRQTTDGYATLPIIWNGYDANGSKVGRGIYIYRVSIRTIDGEKAFLTGRMVIL